MADRLKKKLLTPSKVSTLFDVAAKRKQGLSTGSTVMNLAFTGFPDVGYFPGLCYSFIGDASSGKTVIALSALAEASVSPKFKDHLLVFDNPEGGAMMDFVTYYGAGAAARTRPPNNGKSSATLEEFYYNITTLLDTGKPMVYVFDSMDAVWTENDEEIFSKKRRAFAKGKSDDSATYGTAKAKLNSSNLRVVCSGLQRTNSILIVISQTRDNIGFNSRFSPKTYSGGKAIRFYSRVQLWTSIKGNIMQGESHAGIHSQIKLTKNHTCGWEGKIEVPILAGYGVDDVGGMVDFLTNEGHWDGTKEGRITATEIDFDGSREELIDHVEKESLEDDVRYVVATVWQEKRVPKVERKPRYA